MGWRDIRKYTDRSVARIGKAEYERQRKWNEVKETIGEGVSLWQKHQEGKADQAALEQFGKSEGLTYDKKSKSFYGTQEGSTEEWTDESGDEFWDVKDKQHYKISPAELKTMQSFGKYTDKGISDFVSTKDGNIKKGYQSEGMPVYEKTFMEKMKQNKGISLGDYGKTAWGMLTPGSKTKSTDIVEDTYHKDETATTWDALLKERGDTYTNPPVIGSFAEGELYDWEGEIQEEHEFQDTNILRNKAKEDEMKNLLDIQRKNQQEFDAKVVADKKFQEEEKIRIERREKELNEFNSEKIKLDEAKKMNLEKAINKNKALKNILPADPSTARGKLQQQSAMSIMFNGRK